MKYRHWYRVVGFAVAKMSRLRLLLNYGPFPLFPFPSLCFASLRLTRSFHDRENKLGAPSYLRDYEIIFSQPLWLKQSLSGHLQSWYQHGKHAHMHVSNIVTKNNRQTWWTMNFYKLNKLKSRHNWELFHQVLVNNEVCMEIWQRGSLSTSSSSFKHYT